MRLFITLVLLAISLTLFSQDKLVMDSEKPEAEFHAAINPTDTSNIVIAIQNDFGGSLILSIYHTHDFGETWEKSDYIGSDPNGNAGDPVLSFDADGNLFLVNLSATSQALEIILSKSTDGGITWEKVKTLPSFEPDKPWLAIDRYETSPYKGNVYIPMVDDDLNLFALDDTLGIIANQVVSNQAHLPSVVVRKDGVVFVSYVDISMPNVLHIQQYNDGGSKLIHDTVIDSFPDYTFNAMDISTRFQPTAYLAIDNSDGEYGGRLYMSYTASEADSSNYFNVYLTYSDDNGETWSTPKTIHSNQENEVQQFYSSLFVNDKGVLVADWYDRKGYDKTSQLTDFYFAASYDGGGSFSEVKLTSSPSDFHFVIPSSDNFGIGEYHQLVATEFQAIAFWSDGRTNDTDLDLYMAKVNLNPGLVGLEEKTKLSTKYSFSSLYPLPAKDVVYSDINIKNRTQIKYDIINAKGEAVVSSNWVDYTKGTHQLSVKLDVPVGVYYVNIKTKDGFYKSMKLIRQ